MSLKEKTSQWLGFNLFSFEEQKQEQHGTVVPNSDQMGVSKNRGTPKSSIFIGFSIINHPFCFQIKLFQTNQPPARRRYKIEHAVGAGHFTRAYLATDLESSTKVHCHG